MPQDRHCLLGSLLFEAPPHKHEDVGRQVVKTPAVPSLTSSSGTSTMHVACRRLVELKLPLHVEDLA